MTIGAACGETLPIDDQMCDTYMIFINDLFSTYRQVLQSGTLDLNTVEDFIDDKCRPSSNHRYVGEHPYFKSWCYQVFFQATPSDHRNARDFLAEVNNGRAQSDESIFYNSFCPCDRGNNLMNPRYLFTCGTCAAGKYYDDGVCNDCPDGGTSAKGAAAITECYLPTTGGTDATGTWVYPDKCYYAL